MIEPPDSRRISSALRDEKGKLGRHDQDRCKFT
jgi:hypothetical protein